MSYPFLITAAFRLRPSLPDIPPKFPIPSMPLPLLIPPDKDTATPAHHTLRPPLHARSHSAPRRLSTQQHKGKVDFRGAHDNYDLLHSHGTLPHLYTSTQRPPLRWYDETGINTFLHGVTRNKWVPRMTNTLFLPPTPCHLCAKRGNSLTFQPSKNNSRPKPTQEGGKKNGG